MLAALKNRFTAAFAAASQDNIGILAAGVAFYAFLALVPMLAACVLAYGLFADPETVAKHIRSLASMLPAASAELIGTQLQSVVEGSSGKKTLGLLIALGIALVGARNGAASAVTAVTLAYNRKADRGFFKGLGLALAITGCAIVGSLLIIVVLGATAALGDLLPELGGFGVLATKVATYALLLAATVLAAGALYRVSPPGPGPHWRSVIPGALLAGIGGVLATLAFGIYVANFGNYNATYGSLGAVIALLTWLYIVAYVLLFGAELNAVGPDASAGRDST